MNSPLEDVFLNEGQALAVSGNSPLLLDDAAATWLLQEGQVDIFAVQVRDGQPVGPRSFICRAEAGQVLFGVAGQGLLVVGLPGTRVINLSLTRLQQLAQDQAYSPAIAKLVDRWAIGLSAGMVMGLPPKQLEPLEPGKAYSMTLGKNAGILDLWREGVVWVKPETGALRVLGQPDLPEWNHACYFPLTRYTWLEASAPLTLNTLDTLTILQQDTNWASVQEFHRLVAACIEQRVRQERQQDNEHYRARIERDSSLFNRTLEQLAAVVGTTARRTFADAIADPLLATCQIIGQRMGIAFRPPAKAGLGRPQRDPLAEIARASGVRTRRVLLQGEWWRQDSGPMLAFIEDGQRPVALIPASARRYYLCDPADRTRTRVTRELANALAPLGFVFYRPFPDGPVSLWQLLAFSMRGNYGDLTMILLMGVLVGLLGMITPLATGIIFDSIIPQAQRYQLLQMTIGLMVGAFASASFQITQNIATLRMEGKMDASVQAAVWDRILNLPAPFFRQFSVGDLSQRALGINAIRNLLSGTAVSSMLGSIFASFNFLLLYYYSGQLAILATILALVGVTATLVAGYLHVHYQRRMKGMQGKIAGAVLQFVSAIGKLRVSGAEGRAFVVWGAQFAEQKAGNLAVQQVANAMSVFNAMFPTICSMFIFAYMAFYSAGTLTTGAYLAFNAAFGQFLSASLSMSSVVITIIGVLPIYRSSKPIFEGRPEVDLTKADPGELTGDIEVNHVTFRYKPDTPAILKDVSLRIKAGQFVAFAGTSGSGKSTILRLLLGFEIPEAGSVYYDGQDMTGLDIRAVRHQIGVVIQNGRLMAGDIYSNIVGASNLTLEDAWEAARMAGFDEDVNNMPMGMQTVVSEGGGTLSGGQRQRLLIARAMVTRPRIFLFDEATSALDNKTQAIVSHSLERLKATRVVIAHRLSTIINADYIYVVHQGQIVQSGTYRALINQEGLFAELAKRQIA